MRILATILACLLLLGVPRGLATLAADAAADGPCTHCNCGGHGCCTTSSASSEPSKAPLSSAGKEHTWQLSSPPAVAWTLPAEARFGSPATGATHPDLHNPLPARIRHCRFQI